MTQSPDHPELVYLEALQTNGQPAYTIGRPDGKPLWIVVHDMEATESANCAEATAQYFHTGAGGRSVSSHYTVDNNSVVQCVLLRNSAWTVGNRPGNNRGINWEYCGFASQSRAQWLDAFGVAMFERSAPIIQSDAAKYGIPLERRTVAELLAWKPGITSHNDLRVAFGSTTHTDPGSNFPWDVYLEIINGGAMVLTPQDLDAIWDYPITTSGATTVKGALSVANNRAGALTNSQVPAMQADVDALTGKVDALTVQVTEIKALIEAGGGGGSGTTPAQVTAIVRAELNNTKLGPTA
jgi:hypothetical protein